MPKFTILATANKWGGRFQRVTELSDESFYCHKSPLFDGIRTKNKAENDDFTGPENR